jgi:antitoxin (DNA-binding transcriptional repressor) of toxin-antitoxin stability system
MKKTSITVTEASRNFADCVNRAHYQNVAFVLLKNGESVARLVPGNEKVCAGRDLAEALAKTDLPENEARAWHRDLEAACKTSRHRPTNGDNPGRRCRHSGRERRFWPLKRIRRNNSLGYSGDIQ